MVQISLQNHLLFPRETWVRNIVFPPHKGGPSDQSWATVYKITEYSITW